MGISGHILIIDDEAALRQTLARILQRAGLEVTTAASGQEGLAILAQHPCNLIYLDIRMPGMNGMEMLEKVHAEYPGVPVILFTAQPDLNSALEALRHGATDYLLKPLQPQALIDRTLAILAQQEKERRKHDIQAKMEALQTELRTLDGNAPASPESNPPSVNDRERFLACGKMTLDLYAHRLTIGSRTVSIPPATFDYLVVLVRHAPGVVDYQTLVAEAQGYQADIHEAQDLVKWHIHHLRQALEQDVHNPTILINVRGTGYRLVAD
jgi:DNA-binding response OmpR family regulator